MSNILYIKTSPMGRLSHSITVADAFVDSYLKVHPKDKVKTIDLFTEAIPAFDFKAASAKYNIMHNKVHSVEEQQIWDKIVTVIEEFKSADKFVLAVPMWNFSIPYRLKQYIDIIVQPGYTFTVTEDGNYQGLVTDKPIFIAYARGGEYPEGSPMQAFDLQRKYLELILSFIGFTDIRSVIIEPTLMATPEVLEEKVDGAIAKAKQIAEEF